MDDAPADPVVPQSLQDYLDLINLPETKTAFQSLGRQFSVARSDCNEAGAECTAAFTTCASEFYSGRVLPATLAVPEPGAFGLAGLSLAVLAATRRRLRTGATRG